MASMYETIMELPLFKGIGTDQLSLMLEKTSVEFLNFKKGDLVARSDSQVKFIDFILKGEISLIYSPENLGIKVKEVRGKGNVVGALRLYGMQTTYRCNCFAETDLSLLRIGKEQYMNILLSDSIYLLNFLNYLSAAAQRPVSSFMEGGEMTTARILNTLVSTLASPMAVSVGIIGSDKAIAEYCGIDEASFKIWEKESLEAGIIKYEDGCLLMRF